MSSRIRKHYTHAQWFKISELNAMLETHGAVSTELYLIRWGALTKGMREAHLKLFSRKHRRHRARRKHSTAASQPGGRREYWHAADNWNFVK